MKSKYSRNSVVTLGDSQLKFRLGLARKRLSQYPLDDENFIFINLERPELCSSHAHACTGDLSGRLLEALAVSEAIAPNRDEARVTRYFERIIRWKQKDGLVGIEAGADNVRTPRKTTSGTDRVLNGLLQYYFTFGDHRALDTAKGIGEYILSVQDKFIERIFRPGKSVGYTFITEQLALLYRATGDGRYAAMAERIAENMGRLSGSHSHSYLTVMRGLMRFAYYTGDMSWAALPEKMRAFIRDSKIETASGDIPEAFPASRRNEICSVADWLMLQLWSGLLSGEDEPYAAAEHILWNALYLGQIVTGGSGHRSLVERGYGDSDFQEAWWCCTESSILAMSEVAYNVLTRYEDTYRVNFLIPGEYELEGVKVKISTNWPGKGNAKIFVSGLPEGAELHIRVPADMKNPKFTETEFDGVREISLDGDIGYTVNKWKDTYFLKYGALILAPSNYNWDGFREFEDTTVPEDYLNNSFPSMEYKLELPEKDENGFYKFSHEPYPMWCYFEEGPDSRTAFEDVSVHGEISFENGYKKGVHFWPLCYNVSTLTFYPIPYLFDI